MLLIWSKHPLRKALIAETGATTAERRDFVHKVISRCLHDVGAKGRLDGAPRTQSAVPTRSLRVNSRVGALTSRNVHGMAGCGT
jgi:hypothetical protein